MTEHTVAAAVVYAKDVSRLSTFYTRVAGLSLAHAEGGFHTLESPALQLFVVAMHGDIAARVHVSQPPARRENTALKFVFPVESLGDARRVAAEHGGALKPAEAEWAFGGHRYCDGHDTEGNVFQLRERAVATGDEAND